MHVICKKCGTKIPVADRPSGSTSLSGVALRGRVSVQGGGIGLGEGGAILFGPGGSVGFGPPRSSAFSCSECGNSAEYGTDEIRDD